MGILTNFASVLAEKFTKSTFTSQGNGADLSAGEVVFLIIFLIIYVVVLLVIGKYLYNEIVVKLFGCRPAHSVLQILGLALFLHLVFP